MKVNETKFENFLKTPDTAFVIPVYQRNYDWGPLQCQQLFDDIITIGKSEHPSHFLGSIVYFLDDVYSQTSVKELMIIDGQQRISTLTLLYAVLYRHAKSEGERSLSEQIHEQYLINKFAENEKLKLKPTENYKEALRWILGENDEQPPDDCKHSRMIDNFNFFRKQINADNFKTVRTGMSKLIIVDIALERGKDDPQRIFESINSTGLDLAQADLIRNYILMQLEQKTQHEVFKTYWMPIERNVVDETLLEKKKDERVKESVSNFIRDYLTLKNRNIPKIGKVYAEFKDKVPTTNPPDENLLQELKEYSECYKNLLNPKYENDTDIQRDLAYIKQLEVTVANPFLMQVYLDFHKHVIDKETFIAVLEFIQTYVWRRLIGGYQTNALNKVFRSLYGDIDTTDYLRSLQIAIIRRAASEQMPTDEQIRIALKTKNVYDIHSRNRNYLFERLENFDSKEKIPVTDKITTEHIFPQTPNEKWKLALPDEWEYIHENLLHTIGNLTLTGYNSELSNKSFVEKRDMDGGFKKSKFVFLNEDLKELDFWNKEQIEARTQRLTERFLGCGRNYR